jgi:hypothetical protein
MESVEKVRVARKSPDVQVKESLPSLLRGVNIRPNIVRMTVAVSRGCRANSDWCLRYQ